MGKGSHIQNFLKVYWKLQQITSLTDLVQVDLVGCKQEVICAFQQFGYEKSENIFTRTNVEFDISQFEKDDLSTIDFYVDHEKLSSPATCGYEVEIFNLFSNREKCSPRNKLGTDFLPENFSFKLFQHYPLYIFEGKVQFVVNGNKLKRSDFV